LLVFVIFDTAAGANASRALAICEHRIIFRRVTEDVRPQSGSCARCRRSLGLASCKVGGLWYGNEACAMGSPCPLDSRAPEVPEAWLFTRPQRFFRRRKPKELRGTHEELPVTYQESKASK
jgi:hypothetical protein